MDDLTNDNANVKGCWAKNKSKIDDSINTKVPDNIDRKMCKTKLNNSIEKRTSIVENTYDCSKDHKCDASRKEINALDYPTIPASTPTEEFILIRALDIIQTEANSDEGEIISEDESMMISPNNAIINNKPRG